MKQLTISFYNRFIHFCPIGEKSHFAVPTHFAEIEDSQLDRCFDLLKQNLDVWVWYSHGIRRIVNYCMSHYTFVKAAGGLVETPDGAYLLIRREGNWDIPKGMVEAGESLSQAALREVREETGLTQLTLGPLIVKTYHIYNKYGGWHLKQTSWYRMYTHTREATLPQQEEGITEAAWMDKDICLQRLENSFASLQIVAKKLEKSLLNQQIKRQCLNN